MPERLLSGPLWSRLNMVMLQGQVNSVNSLSGGSPVTQGRFLSAVTQLSWLCPSSGSFVWGPVFSVIAAAVKGVQQQWKKELKSCSLAMAAMCIGLELTHILCAHSSLPKTSCETQSHCKGTEKCVAGSQEWAGHLNILPSSPVFIYQSLKLVTPHYLTLTKH